MTTIVKHKEWKGLKFITFYVDSCSQITNNEVQIVEYVKHREKKALKGQRSGQKSNLESMFM